MSTLSQNSPWIVRFIAYLKERFPLIGHALLIVSYYSSNQFLAQALFAPDQKLHYGSHSSLGALTILFFFFHLRIFDEHKDYHEDLKFHPDRILQRGWITLRDLKWVGGIAIAGELLLAAFRSEAAVVSWALAFVFSVLMLKEFFIAGWLKRHFLVYALSHLCVMPFLALTIFSFTTQRPFWEAPGWFWVYAFVGLLVTFNWEISRKIRAPEDEREGLDSYTKIFGTYGAAHMVLIVRVLDTAIVGLVGWHLKLAPWFYVLLVVLFMVCLFGYVDYRRNTCTKTAKRMETIAGFYIIAFDIILAIALVSQRGLELAW
jgi:4-hydroxybenzoate polyprenyltransferase